MSRTKLTPQQLVWMERAGSFVALLGMLGILFGFLQASFTQFFFGALAMATGSVMFFWAEDRIKQIKEGRHE